MLCKFLQQAHDKNNSHPHLHTNYNKSLFLI